MHLRETNQIRTSFSLGLQMDLSVPRMPMKMMKMRPSSRLETGDAAFRSQVGYTQNQDQCLRLFGLPATWRLSAPGRVRLALLSFKYLFLPNNCTHITFEKLDQLLSLDIRSPVLHQRRTWVTDYLITAHSTKTSVPNLSIFTGSNE